MSSKSLPRVLTIYLLVLTVIIVAAHASSSEEEICRDGPAATHGHSLPPRTLQKSLKARRFLRDYASAWTSTRGRRRPSSLTPRTRPLAASFSLMMRENLSLTNSPTFRRDSLLCQRNRPGSKSPRRRFPCPSFQKMEELGALLFSVGDDDL